jgi:hypothetical protein
MMSALGMEYEKMDVLNDNVMLFYKEHKNEVKCLRCGKSRFIEVIDEDGEKVMSKVAHKQLCYMPLTPRMKQLFLSRKTTRHMRWYKEGVRENDQVMVHLFDSEAWKALDDFDADFTRDARNVHRQMDSRLIIQVRHRTLVGPSLLFCTTFHLLFA